MSNARGGFTRALVSASVLPSLLFTTVVVSLVGTGLVAANTSASETGSVVRAAEPAWRAAYSRRFPGCVSTVLWPVGERPVAFVVRQHSGRVARISVEEAVRRAHTSPPGDGARTLGACRG